jgi:GMP synthase (glutamine-hydrolysing)
MTAAWLRWAAIQLLLPIRVEETRSSAVFPAGFSRTWGTTTALLSSLPTPLSWHGRIRNRIKLFGWPVYGTQFHSELDARRERERLFRYRDHYPEIGSDASFQAVLANLAETSEVDHLLHDFLITFAADNHT